MLFPTFWSAARIMNAKGSERGCSNTTCSAADTNNAPSTSRAAAVGVSAQVYKLMITVYGGLSVL